MRHYLVNPVLQEIENKVIGLYEHKKLSREQAVLILNCVSDSMEQYNLEHGKQSVWRCGRCLKMLESDREVYSLEKEVNQIFGGGWWSDEIELEMAFDGVCRECCDLMMQKYFGQGAKNHTET